MSQWTDLPCKKCQGGKGKKYINLKYCGKCTYAVKKERGRNAHGKALEARYGINRTDYDNAYAFQNGLCFLCRRATGKTRRLSVDHDHATGDVRGLLCRPCNGILGHARDDISFFERAIEYLKDPPFQKMIRGDKPDMLGE